MLTKDGEWIEVYGFHPVFEYYYLRIFKNQTEGRAERFESKEEMEAFLLQFE